MCDEKGMKISFALPESAFSYSTTILKFIPTSKAQLSILTDVSGGIVTGIKNFHKLDQEMSHILKSAPKVISKVKDALRAVNKTQDVEIMKKYCSRMFSMLANFDKTLDGKHPYTKVIKDMKNIIEVSADCTSQLRYVQTFFLDEHRRTRQAKVIA